MQLIEIEKYCFCGTNVAYIQANRLFGCGKMKNQIKLLCGAVALVMAGQVSALTTWTLDNVTTGTTAGSNSVETVGPIGLSATGNNGGIQSNTVTSWPSLGIHSSNEVYGSPQHSIDNSGSDEMMLLTFSKAVSLTQVKIGWTGSDSDYTILAYVGNGGPDWANKSWSTLSLITSSNTSNGWKVISNGQAPAVTNGSATNVNFSTNTFSSFWLVGAYNPLGQRNVVSSLTTNDDYLKLKAVTGNICSGNECPNTGTVPEPGSLALFGLGLIGLVGVRRNRKH